MGLMASEYIALTCDFSGHRLGPLADGRAQVLPPAQGAGPKKALARKYGWRFHWLRIVLLVSRARRRGGAPVIVAVLPSASSGPVTGDPG